MPGPIRAVLDELGKKTLRRLCDQRELATSRRLDDMREALARSFRGEHRELLTELTRSELHSLLDIWEFTLDDRVGGLSGLTRASRDDLARAVKRLYVDEWVPTHGRPHPLGPDGPIRLSFEDDDLDELDEEDVDTDDAPAQAAEDDDEDPETEFLRSFDQQVGARVRTNAMVKTLVNALGRHRAQSRLRLRAVRHLGRVLAHAGYATEPDLTTLEKSPGIDARVTVTRHIRPPRPATSKQDQDGLGAGGIGSRPFPATTAPPVSSNLAVGFEIASERLKFLVSLASAIHPCGEQARGRAVVCAVGTLSLGPADHVRLRALAHQYVAGQADLRHTVAALRTNLSKAERIALVGSLRELAPACQGLEELIAAYSQELEVAATPPAVATTAVPPPPPRSEQVEEGHTVEPTAPLAGGSRENNGLDSIFGESE
jgi:hypothetical protein